MLVIYHRIDFGEHLLKTAILVYTVFAEMVPRPRDAEGLAFTVTPVACAGHFIPLILSVSASSGVAASVRTFRAVRLRMSGTHAAVADFILQRRASEIGVKIGKCGRGDVGQRFAGQECLM